MLEIQTPYVVSADKAADVLTGTHRIVLFQSGEDPVVLHEDHGGIDDVDAITIKIRKPMGRPGRKVCVTKVDEKALHHYRPDNPGALAISVGDEFDSIPKFCLKLGIYPTSFCAAYRLIQHLHPHERKVTICGVTAQLQDDMVEGMVD